jgi:hypothetical protein
MYIIQEGVTQMPQITKINTLTLRKLKIERPIIMKVCYARVLFPGYNFNSLLIILKT